MTDSARWGQPPDAPAHRPRALTAPPPRRSGAQTTAHPRPPPPRWGLPRAPPPTTAPTPPVGCATNGGQGQHPDPGGAGLRPPPPPPPRLQPFPQKDIGREGSDGRCPSPPSASPHNTAMARGPRPRPPVPWLCPRHLGRTCRGMGFVSPARRGRCPRCGADVAAERRALRGPPPGHRHQRQRPPPGAGWGNGGGGTNDRWAATRGGGVPHPMRRHLCPV